jgi:hypothetical protein
MNYLKHKEFVPLAPDSGFVRVNHDSMECAGDSQSMKIEVKEDGSLFAYCHRCGKSGRYNTPYFTAAKAARNHSQADSLARRSGQRADGYKRATCDMDQWSPDARQWIIKAGISQLEVTANDIRYDKEIDGIFLSVRNHHGLCGYILRRLNYDGPKCINDFDCTAVPICHVSRPPISSSDMVVLVEDILSCIKVGRQYNAVALLGTTASTPLINWLGKTYNEYVVWLDDDSKIVKNKQRVLRNTLSLLGESRIITGVGRDPKYLSNTEIKEVIE